MQLGRVLFHVKPKLPKSCCKQKHEDVNNAEKCHYSQPKHKFTIEHKHPTGARLLDCMRVGDDETGACEVREGGICLKRNPQAPRATSG